MNCAALLFRYEKNTALSGEKRLYFSLIIDLKVLSHMDNKRRHSRMNISLKVELSHPELGAHSLQTRDMSDSGLFVFYPQPEEFTVGHKVTVQVAAILGDGEEAPIVPMEIMRICDAGIGLQFIDNLDAAHQESECVVA